MSASGTDTVASPSTDALAGVLVEPPAGSVGIPPNVAALVVRFTVAVEPTGRE
jgi:hypothetical protein